MDWVPRFTGEMLLCGLLGKLLYAPPEKDWILSLATEGVFDDSPFAAEQPDVIHGLELLRSWSQGYDAVLRDQAFDELRVDYVRLFVGMGRVLAPPYESVYFDEERTVFQERTLQVRAWYRRFGLEVVAGSGEPDDHIGLELGFLAQLAKLSLRALAEQNTENLECLLRNQHAFLSEHLLKWAPLWCALVDQHARTSFYRGVAWLVQGALTELGATMDPDVRHVESELVVRPEALQRSAWAMRSDDDSSGA